MENKLKLNKKNTFLVGLSFFVILMLWQVYNNYCPIILEYLLKDKFNDSDLTYVIGIIMALDNIVALFLMPLVGVLSDKTKTKFGRRMPYILCGTLLSLIIFPFIALAFIWNTLIGVIIVMGLILVIMQGYRNPAVALMPDITPKPLRSMANGIINLVGYAGAVLAALLGMIFSIKRGEDGQLPLISEAQGIVLWPFIITSLIMLVVLVVLALSINENKLVEETREAVELGELESKALETSSEADGEGKLGKKDFVNLLVLLGAIFLWFMAFNAIETFNSLFAKNVLGDSGIASTGVIIMTFSSILSFALFSKLSNSLGRKFVILIGLILLVVGFAIIALTTFVLVPNPDELLPATRNVITIILYACTVVLGIGWALINVNSFPMVVELANKKNVGKYTGFYYSASMLAQTITPILVGLIMTFNVRGQSILYLYSTIFAIAALIVFIFVKEKSEKKKEESEEL
jgi:MFS family permease